MRSYHRPVNYLSTAVQLTNRLVRFWADGGSVYYKRVSSPSFLVWSQLITSWFAIALDEIRTRRILREKADFKQSNCSPAVFIHLFPIRSFRYRKRKLSSSSYSLCSLSFKVSCGSLLKRFSRWKKK